MIRFSAVLVTVAIGVLIGGGVTSKLSLVYIAILIAAVALVTLATGVVIKRKELFGPDSGFVPATAGGPVPPASSGDGRDRGGAAFGSASPVASPAASAPAASAPAVATPLSAQADHTAAPTRTDLQAARASKSPPTRADLKAARTQVDLFGSGSAPAGPGTSGAATAGADSAPAETRASWFERLGNSAAATAEAPAGKAPAAGDPAAGDPAAGDPAAGDTAHGEPADEDSGQPAVRSWFDRRPAAAHGWGDPADPPAAWAKAADDKAATDNADDNNADDNTKASGPAAPTADDRTTDTDATRVVVAGPGEPRSAAGSGHDAADAVHSNSAGTAKSSTDGTAETGDSEADAGQPVNPGGPVADDAEPQAASPSSDTAQVTVVRGVPRYHTSDCILIRFLPKDDLQQMTVPAATATGATPCAVCQHGD